MTIVLLQNQNVSRHRRFRNTDFISSTILLYDGLGSIVDN